MVISEVTESDDGAICFHKKHKSIMEGYFYFLYSVLITENCLFKIFLFKCYSMQTFHIVLPL